MNVIQYEEIVAVQDDDDNGICHECGKYGPIWIIFTKGDKEGNAINTIRLCGKCFTKLAKKITER